MCIHLIIMQRKVDKWSMIIYIFFVFRIWDRFIAYPGRRFFNASNILTTKNCFTKSCKSTRALHPVCYITWKRWKIMVFFFWFDEWMVLFFRWVGDGFWDRMLGILAWTFFGARNKNELKISKFTSFSWHFAQPIPSSEAYLPGPKRMNDVNSQTNQL